jgi:hypothetical protein
MSSSGSKILVPKGQPLAQKRAEKHVRVQKNLPSGSERIDLICSFSFGKKRQKALTAMGS